MAILGEPTRVERGILYDTLFYQGEAPGSGSISGFVRLMNGQVYRVSSERARKAVVAREAKRKLAGK